MYAVICYLNYRKSLNFEVLKTYNSFFKARSVAKEYAKLKYEDIVDYVVTKELSISKCMVEYTTGKGYRKDVYAVIEIPNPQNEFGCDSNNDFCKCEQVCTDDNGILYLNHLECCKEYGNDSYNSKLSILNLIDKNERCSKNNLYINTDFENEPTEFNAVEIDSNADTEIDSNTDTEIDSNDKLYVLSSDSPSSSTSSNESRVVNDIYESYMYTNLLEDNMEVDFVELDDERVYDELDDDRIDSAIEMEDPLEDMIPSSILFSNGRYFSSFDDEEYEEYEGDEEDELEEDDEEFVESDLERDYYVDSDWGGEGYDGECYDLF